MVLLADTKQRSSLPKDLWEVFAGCDPAVQGAERRKEEDEEATGDPGESGLVGSVSNSNNNLMTSIKLTL